jgi:GNAT superfamily N-acetyltransferase
VTAPAGPPPLDVAALTGSDLTPVLPEIARLRIAVFRAYPYLYDGTVDYEAAYLAKLAAAPGGVCVVVRDAGRVVGASTGAPLLEHDAEFATPFVTRGYDAAALFYCAESVLERAYRGRGLGHVFFDRREAHARALGGFTHAIFSSVVRPANHPLCPADYRPLDDFWRARGYAPAEGIVASYAWKDVDQPGETVKPMQFWIKAL